MNEQLRLADVVSGEEPGALRHVHLERQGQRAKIDPTDDGATACDAPTGGGAHERPIGDARAEHAVFERFPALARGRTTFLISHRFPTVRMADRILVLDSGRIVEEGTHDSLVAAGGRYAQLFSLQAHGYV
jgi:hypothetical protein